MSAWEELLIAWSDNIGSGLAAVAQSLINISEGLTEIEKGSQLYEGMSLLMEPRLAMVVRAAPDLLDAAKAALLEMADAAERENEPDSHAMTKLRDAIAKAEDNP